MTVARKLVLLALMCAAGLAGLCVLTSPASAGSLRLTSAEQSVLKLINAARAEHGLQPVHARTSLCRAARAHSREMVRCGYFSHLSASGESQVARMHRYGYGRSGCSSWSTGEVIAYGGGLLGRPQAIVDGWLQSQVHRALLLDPRWRDIGVGRAYGVFRGASGVAVYTVDLGRRTL